MVGHMPPERAVLDATDTTLAPVENRPADSRIAGWSLGGLRILMGLMWLQNVGWKQPPFSRQRGFECLSLSRREYER